MKKKIIVLSTLITSLVLLIMFALGAIINREAIYSEARSNLVTITQIYASSYNQNNKLLTIDNENIRETIIDQNGVVILDSKEQDVSQFENHLNREEIQYALKGTPKIVERYSSSLNISMMYYALKVGTDNSYVFVRVAYTISNIDGYVYNYLPYFISIYFLLMLIYFVVIIYISKYTMKPLLKIKDNLEEIIDGNYHPEITLLKDDEINKIVSKIDILNLKLNSAFAETRDQKEKLDYILNNIADGIIVFDCSLNIVLINRNAYKIFERKNLNGKNFIFLTDNETFSQNLTVIQKSHKTITFKLEINNVYFVNFTYTESGLILAVLTNITYEANEGKIRSEFFANASHELKTPLTSIKGFNELIELNVKDPKIKKYTEKISEESLRLLGLIEDMMSLSKLENKKILNPISLDCLNETDEVFNELSLLANKKNISLKVEGNTNILMEKEDLHKMLKNLIENAIKYNNVGGYVLVHLSNNQKENFIEVKDNGFGIPTKDLSRIFERFYRVDESRSRDSGGTGLGLAIVKHIVNVYGGEIKVSSIINIGTTFTIVFEK